MLTGYILFPLHSMHHQIRSGIGVEIARVSITDKDFTAGLEVVVSLGTFRR